MQLFITILHVVLCIALILIILLQPGKDQGAVFGGGGGGNRMYAPRGQQNVLGRATTAVAVLFMLTSISLAWYSTEQARDDSDVIDILNEGEDDEDDGKGFGNVPAPDPTPAPEPTPLEVAPEDAPAAPADDAREQENPE